MPDLPERGVIGVRGALHGRRQVPDPAQRRLHRFGFQAPVRGQEQRLRHEVVRGPQRHPPPDPEMAGGGAVIQHDSRIPGLTAEDDELRGRARPIGQPLELQAQGKVWPIEVQQAHDARVRVR